MSLAANARQDAAAHSRGKKESTIEVVKFEAGVNSGPSGAELPTEQSTGRRMAIHLAIVVLAKPRGVRKMGSG